LQFADDTAIISSDNKSAQALLDLNTAWCVFADMKVRIDKCSTFGMRKQSGNYMQFQPMLTIGGKTIPAIENGGSFKYLGKIFDYDMKNNVTKTILVDRLKNLLKTTSELDVKPQQKMKILNLFIPNQLKFELRMYDISYTWITQKLDILISNAVRDWLELPISTCVSEMLSLPRNQGGLGIKSLKETAETLRLSQRVKQKFSKNEESRQIWESTSAKNINIDSIISRSKDRSSALKILKEKHIETNFKCISLLEIQGKIIKSINESFNKATLIKWAGQLDNLAAPIYNFVRKAIQQQLPTASNLSRWGISADPRCPLCRNIQSNKHVLSCCSSNIALERYKTRHDKVLKILVDWIISNSKPNRTVFVDLEGVEYKPLSNVFVSLRPDIAILGPDNTIYTLELTICHETNFSKSKLHKETKYENLRSNLIMRFRDYKIKNYTVEVGTLGLISNIKNFCSINLNSSVTDRVRAEIANSVISSSFTIYCDRNNITL
jgi:hypothetical protein